MDVIDTRLADFLRRCDDVAALRGFKRSTLSTKIFNDGKRLKEIEAGGDIGIKRLAVAERALAKLGGEEAAGDPAANAEI
jgi:hypothetical protein